ncbi:Mesothelin-like protein [Pteropus alecto]|uniref:Mesothelin-like protein n=1 Tax=Pteropus alecto TaxID=9402 RepID=L5KHR6_PTEAL|nr:Mesothelin-like protein [Pteropus alecto]
MEESKKTGAPTLNHRCALVSLGLILFMWLTAHCSRPQAEGFSQGGLDASRANVWATTSLLQDFWCQPANQLSRDQLSALIRRMASQQVLLKAWQLSCLANLATQHGLQGDFALHPPDLLLFYNTPPARSLAQVREADCRAFTRRAAQGDTELLANLPDQRAALQHSALACLGGRHPWLSASDLLLLGILVCDMDASIIVASDPHVLQNLQRCPRLTPAQQAALNKLLASGRTMLGPPSSWNLEGLKSLGPLATYISPSLWMQVQEAIGLDFFGSMVAAFRAGTLSQHDARRFVTSFLKAKLMSSRPKRGTATGRPCTHGNITAATLQDDLFLVHYDCLQLESCLGSRVLRASLDPLLQHPLPKRVIKAKLAQIYPSGIPEEQLQLITSLVYLYSRTEIGLWNITSRDTVMALLASDVALENQTEAILQKFLDHKGNITSALLVAIGGSRLCWMSPQQIQAIQPSEFRLAGALDISSCPQRRKDILYTRAREAFSSIRTMDTYYHFIRPYLGGAPVEDLQHLAQANISMDIDTFTNLNPQVLQNLSVDNVIMLLGQNVVDLQKARSHPIIISWLHSKNRSTLDELRLDKDPISPTNPTSSAHLTTGTPNTTPWVPHPATTSGRPGNDAPTSGSPPAHLGYLPIAMGLPSSLLWLLYRSTLGSSWDCSWGTCTMAPEHGTVPAPHAGKLGLVGGAGHQFRPRCKPQAQGT